MSVRDERGKVLLGTRVAGKIVAHIRDQGLGDGDELPSEADLADTFAVSQRVVRDALRALSQQGIIETRQGKRALVGTLRPVAVRGYFRLVMDADESAIEDLVEFRLAVETKAAGLAASRVTPQELDELRDVLARCEKVGDNLAARVDLDLAFHRGIVRASRNRFFDAVHEALSEELAAERESGQELTESLGGDHTESNAEHRALLQALGSGDVALAEQLMRSHLERVLRRFRGRS